MKHVQFVKSTGNLKMSKNRKSHCLVWYYNDCSVGKIQIIEDNIKVV